MRRRDPDDTVVLRAPAGEAAAGRTGRRRRGGALAVAAAVLLLAAAGGGLGWWARHRAAPVAAVPVPAAPVAAVPVPAVPVAPAAEPIPLAGEEAIRTESPAVLSVLRFAPNPAVVVLDFPTLAEQGRMLNRLAAWAEKAGVPHDRLLSDAELAAAILASGTTEDTYYYGHDYRGADVARFFAVADRDGVALRPEEERLRRIMRRAQAEAAGFGALISLPRADAANGTTPAMRATILHHELSHGEYFTDPAYAAFVQTVWRSVLSDADRAAFRSYLAGEGYDPGLEDVMTNEMQAYLMHTPDPVFFDPGRLGIPPARLAQIRDSFKAGMPPGWLRNETPRRRRAKRRPGRGRGRGRGPGPERGQRAGRVSRTMAAAAADPPCRRRESMAD